MTVPTPGPVTKLLDAANSHHTEDFLASFAHDGVVDDWGREYIGRGRSRNGATGNSSARKYRSL
jgi:hypothetical protein